MSINLRIVLVIFSIFLLLITAYILKRGRIPEKYSLLRTVASLRPAEGAKGQETERAWAPCLMTLIRFWD